MDVPLKIKGKYTIFEIFEGPRKSIQIWSKSWPETGQKLARTGQKLAKSWPESGPKLARNGSKSDQKELQNLIKKRSKVEI